MLVRPAKPRIQYPLKSPIMTTMLSEGSEESRYIPELCAYLFKNSPADILRLYFPSRLHLGKHDPANAVLQ